jgi:DnaJ-class molecular chaperone
MSTEVDYYELLEVTREANDTVLKTSYRKLAMKYHPDRNPGDAAAEAKFKQISEAYDCLKDPQKRAAYDRFGHAAFQNGGPGAGGGGFGGGFGGADFGDIGDIFETIFGGAGGGGRQQARRGADLRYDLEINLDDAFHGKDVEIEIEVATPASPVTARVPSRAAACVAATCAAVMARCAPIRASSWWSGRAQPVRAGVRSLKSLVVPAAARAVWTSARSWKCPSPRASIPARASA